MSTSNIPVIRFTLAGPVVPAESEILAGVQSDINAAFGNKLTSALETPQGQLASSETAFIGDNYDQQVLLFSGMDPAYADGRQQDGIARIYFLGRLAAQSTVVQCLCTGLVRAAVPAGTLAKDTFGNEYACVGGGTIGTGGTVTLPFACTIPGPTVCAAGTVSLFQTVPGLDGITNPADGVIGTLTETRAEFELRRQLTVEANSVGPNAAMLGAVLKVPGVLDAYVVDNSTSFSATIDGVLVPANGVFASVAGGDPLAVATALWSKKAPGGPWSGNTTETVTDLNPLYATPPSYTVQFQTAIPQNFVIVVTLKSTTGVPNNALELIRGTSTKPGPVALAFAGQDGGTRARINSLVLATRYVAGIAALGPWVEIINIKLGSSVAPSAAFTASITGFVMTVTGVASGGLGVGQTIEGAGLPAGLRIASLGTGAGSTGTYNLNLPQTVASENMIAISANLDDVQVGAAHVPVLALADIQLVLV